MNKLELKDEQLSRIITAAVIESLTPESREILIREAIENHLMQVDDSSYGKPKLTRLQKIFNEVCSFEARKVAHEYFKGDEGKALMSTIIQQAVEKIHSTGMEAITQSMADGLTTALEKMHY